MDGNNLGRNHLPLSRGSGCAAGRGGRGVRAHFATGSGDVKTVSGRVS